MADKAELLAIANSMIQKLHDDVNALQADALRFSAAHDYDRCADALKKQREAIDAQIAMVQAAKYLEQN